MITMTPPSPPRNFKVPACCSVVLLRRDDLEKLVPDRDQAVVKPRPPGRGSRPRRQNKLKLAADTLEVVGDHTDLTDADVARHVLPSSPHDVNDYAQDGAALGGTALSEKWRFCAQRA